MFDENGNQRVISNVRILPNEYTKDIISGLEQKPSAVLINSGLKGYCRTVLDSDSLQFFLENLSQIDDDLTRSYIWRTLWDNLKINVVSGDEFLECFIDHFIPETEEYTMPVALQTVQFIIKYHLSEDLEQKASYQKTLKEVFITKLKTNCITKSMEVLLIQELVSMMSADDNEDVNSALKWIRDLAIDLGEGHLFKIDKLQRYMLLKLLFKSKTLDPADLNKLLQRERQIDLCDVDDIERLGVQAAIAS